MLNYGTLSTSNPINTPLGRTMLESIRDELRAKANLTKEDQEKLGAIEERLENGRFEADSEDQVIPQL